MSRTSRSAIRRRCRSPPTSTRCSATSSRATRTGSPTSCASPSRSGPSPTTLTERTGMAWDPDDVAMTNGGFAAIAVALRTLVEPGDEVDLPVAALVLLRGPDPRGGRRAGAGHARAAGLRPRRRPHRRGHRSAHPGGHRQQPAQPERPRSTRRSALDRAGAGPDRCLRAHRPPGLDHVATSRTTGSCSTGASPTPRPSSIRTRSSPTRTARRCWRPGSASAT